MSRVVQKMCQVAYLLKRGLGGVGRGMKHSLMPLEVEAEAKVEAKNFAPKNGHLGRTELVVRPAI
jgi:hypothetical protein